MLYRKLILKSNTRFIVNIEYSVRHTQFYSAYGIQGQAQSRPNSLASVRFTSVFISKCKYLHAYRLKGLINLVFL